MKKVLIIDDEADARKMIGRRLAASQFEVIEAGDGLSGLRKAKDGKPDIILLDIVMPDMDGARLYDALKEDPATKKIPVIFVTVLAQGVTPDLRSLGLAEGDYWIIGKPYDPDELISKIRYLLGMKEA